MSRPDAAEFDRWLRTTATSTLQRVKCDGVTAQAPGRERVDPSLPFERVLREIATEDGFRLVQERRSPLARRRFGQKLRRFEGRDWPQQELVESEGVTFAVVDGVEGVYASGPSAASYGTSRSPDVLVEVE